MNSDKILHYTSMEAALASLFGKNTKIKEYRRIFGGDINEALALTLSNGKHIFMKANEKENADFFIAESRGLSAIAHTGTVGTPQILCSGTEESRGGYSFLLLELITEKKHRQDYWECFARELASLHMAPTQDLTTGKKFGFSHDNYIGMNIQRNTCCDSWIEFFRDCRLEPQFKDASGYFGTTDIKKISRLLDKLENILIEPEYPSLLHGDLWSGNIIPGNDGRAWLIDPAAYVGHAEAEIAMTELFGGFPSLFFASYREIIPLQPGYQERRDIYNLYHVLNHLNIFGEAYLSSVKRTLDRYGS